MLRFFGVEFHADISVGAANWEIRRLMSSKANATNWDKYLYLTKDFSRESDELLPHDLAEFRTLQLPDGWDSQKEVREFQSEFVEFILADESPFDMPQPRLQFAGKRFCFTGKFEFGPRTECVKSIEGLGGEFTKSVRVSTDYLVIGCLGNPTWVKDQYGRKIERAILLRREKGSPAIISENHWMKSIQSGR